MCGSKRKSLGTRGARVMAADQTGGIVHGRGAGPHTFTSRSPESDLLTPANRALQQLPDNIPGAALVEKYFTPNAVQTLVHIRQIHEAILDLGLESDMPGVRMTADAVKTQHDIYTIVDYLIKSGCLHTLYIEGANPGRENKRIPKRRVITAYQKLGKSKKSLMGVESGLTRCIDSIERIRQVGFALLETADLERDSWKATGKMDAIARISILCRELEKANETPHRLQEKIRMAIVKIDDAIETSRGLKRIYTSSAGTRFFEENRVRVLFLDDDALLERQMALHKLQIQRECMDIINSMDSETRRWLVENEQKLQDGTLVEGMPMSRRRLAKYLLELIKQQSASHAEGQIPVQGSPLDMTEIKHMGDALCEMREDAVLARLMALKGTDAYTAIAYLIFGGRHDWLPNVERWNVEHPEHPFSLGVVTPISYTPYDSKTETGGQMKQE